MFLCVMFLFVQVMSASAVAQDSNGTPATPDAIAGGATDVADGAPQSSEATQQSDTASSEAEMGSSKFTVCILGLKYREVRPDGRIMGGAMYYLSRGLGELALAKMIVITGAWQPDGNPEFAKMIEAKNGAGLMSLVMDGEIPGFRYVLAIAVFLFAFSTMISWSYYGERCWAYLFGDGASMSFRIIFLVFTFLGSILTSTNFLEFGDLMIFGMAIPNIIGLVLLSGKVKVDLDDYLTMLRKGEFTVRK